MPPKPPIKRPSKLRAGVVATCFAAVVFTGAIYGAGLKTRQEWNEKRSEFRESPVEEQIAVLETQKGHLVAQRQGLEEKLDQFNQRVQEREAKLKAVDEAAKS